MASARGQRVVLFSRRQEALRTLAEQMPGEPLWVAGDIGTRADVERLAARVRARHGAVHQVFSSAGYAPFGPLASYEDADISLALRTHVAGPMHLVRALAPLMAPGGSVLLTASGMHQRPLSDASLWAACTHAVVGLTRALAVELAPQGIRVNALSHGPVDTAIFEDYDMPPEAVTRMKRELAERTLLGRMASAEEIAAMALGLLETDGYMTGVEITANGGWHLVGV